MRKDYVGQTLSNIIIIFLAAIIISSCKVSNKTTIESEIPPALPFISRDETQTKAQFCSDLIHSHIDAWKSRDIDNLKQMYTDDIVHYDGIPLFVGIDEVLDMAKDMWLSYSGWEMKAGNTYISDEECLGEWINWDIFSLSEDEPGVEFDLIDYRDSKISYWRLFYDSKFLKIFGHTYRIDEDLLKSLASAWSGGNSQEIGNLYSTEAIFVDSLFKTALEGSNAISDYASSYSAQFPDVEWELIKPFAEDYSTHMDKEFHPQGGVYTITLKEDGHVSCEIRAAVIITPDGNNKIDKQSIYYDAESLINCGLAK